MLIKKYLSTWTFIREKIPDDPNDWESQKVMVCFLFFIQNIFPTARLELGPAPWVSA